MYGLIKIVRHFHAHIWSPIISIWTVVKIERFGEVNSTVKYRTLNNLSLRQISIKYTRKFDIPTIHDERPLWRKAVAHILRPVPKLQLQFYVLMLMGAMDTRNM